LIFLINFTILYSSNPSIAISTLLGEGIWVFIGGKGIDAFLASGIWVILATFYVLIIIPIVLIAIAHVAHNECKISAAFRFREIFNKIATIRWVNFIEWYLMTGITSFILYMIGFFCTVSLSKFYLHNSTVGLFLVALIVFPYIYMYLYRAVALIYTHNENSEDYGE
jgi:hypothetical protein